MKPLSDIKVEKLRVLIYKDRSQMGKAAADEAEKSINTIISEKGSATAVFAAAPSQNEFLAELKRKDIPWEKVRAFHMDEYIGLGPPAPESFASFLEQSFFSEISLQKVHYIDGRAKDPQTECLRYSTLLKQYPPDIVFLGIGENGHLAFNDPGVADFNDPEDMKVVELDAVCRTQQVNDGCFQRLEDVPVRAMTLTIPFLFNIPEALIIVPGSTKKEAVYNTLFSDVSESVPSTILRGHGNAVLYLDKESGHDVINRLSVGDCVEGAI